MTNVSEPMKDTVLALCPMAEDDNTYRIFSTVHAIRENNQQMVLSNFASWQLKRVWRFDRESTDVLS